MLRARSLTYLLTLLKYLRTYVHFSLTDRLTGRLTTYLHLIIYLPTNLLLAYSLTHLLTCSLTASQATHTPSIKSGSARLRVRNCWRKLLLMSLNPELATLSTGRVDEEDEEEEEAEAVGDDSTSAHPSRQHPWLRVVKRSGGRPISGKEMSDLRHVEASAA